MEEILPVTCEGREGLSLFSEDDGIVFIVVFSQAQLLLAWLVSQCLVSVCMVTLFTLHPKWKAVVSVSVALFHYNVTHRVALIRYNVTY